VAIPFKIFKPKAKCVFRLFLFLIFLSGALRAQQPQHNHITAAFRQYLNFEFDSCQTSLQHVSKSAEAFYLSHLLVATKIFLSDDPEQFKNQKYLESEYLAAIDNDSYDDASKAFLKTEIKIHWSVLKMKYGEELSAFWSMRQAYHMAQENLQKHPDFLPANKSMGLLYILFGIVPEKYNWLLSIFGITGDVGQGRENLQKVWNRHGFYALESGVIMALLDSYLLNQPQEGLRKISKISIDSPALLIDYVHCLILMKNASSDKVERIIDTATEKYPQPFKLPLMYYISGEVNLQKGDIDKAIDGYDKFLTYQKGKGLVKDAYFKTGICYLIKGDKDMSTSYLESARLSGWSINEADQYAENQLQSGHISNKDLYRLRFATDGGFYDLAKDIQQNIKRDELEGEDLCEYYYRTGRLMQNAGDLRQAIIFYEKTIENQGDQNWYYAPNASLQLGLMQITENRQSDAKVYLQAVFSYKKNYPYQKSIKQKAKAALKSLDK
jgi:tetratricopeptide (TPR) repeat protein